MYLVDTSVWIDYIKGVDCAHVTFLDSLLQTPANIGISDLIYMEIIQGAQNQQNFDRLSNYFSLQQFYCFQDSQKSHQQAAKIYFNCRRKGITVRSTVDCLIAQCAIENKLTLFHHDRDFKQMGTVVSQLKHEHFLLK